MKILLLGLGRANLWVARYLLARNEELFLYEENPEGLLAEAKELLADNRIKRFEDTRYDLVVTSPGFPINKGIIAELKSKAIPIIDETEFTYQHLPHPSIIGVTGTNGKSTTVSLISNILSCAGIKNFLGGNLAPGKPFSQALFEPSYDFYVLEMSSFQLTRIERFQAHIAVLTNISIDHLNWHKDFNEYVSAKMRIFANQNRDDFAVINSDDKLIKDLTKDLKSRIINFGKSATDGSWFDSTFNYGNEILFANNNLPLLGEHNLMNIAAAIAVAKILNIPSEQIEAGIRSFKPLRHRLEDLGIHAGIHYINNSMSTNERAAIASFQAIKGSKIVIVGGKEKGDRCRNYLDLLIKEAKACVILGENAQDVANYFKAHNFRHYSIAKDMTEAIQKSRDFARPGDIIFLNPGFASYDLFKDFQERGEAFRNGICQA